MLDPTPARPILSLLDPTTRGRRWLPFVLVTFAAVASVFFPGGHVHTGDFVWSLLALATCPLLLRFGAGATRGLTNLAGALAYLIFVGLLVTAQGGVSQSGLFTLALLPILWVALYSPRWSAIVLTTSASVELLILSVLDNDPADVILRKVLFWLLITTGLTISVRQLRDRFSGALKQRDRTIQDVRALAAALRRLTSLRDPDEVLWTATRTACELTSSRADNSRRCSYFVITATRVETIFDDAGHKVMATWPLEDHPQVARVVDTLEPFAGPINLGLLGPSIRDAVRDSGMTDGAWVPVLRGGKLHGVLAVAGRDEPVEDHLLSLLVALGRTVESALDISIAYSDLEAMAGVDPLTGLSNRRGLERAPVVDGSYVIISADLDGFKEINDSLGHAGGDAVLARFAEILRSSVRDGTTVARLGGDEFLMILKDATPETGWLVAGRILAALDDPVLGGMRASFGIASGTVTTPLEVAISRADEAMYQAKRQGGMRAAEWVQSDTDVEIATPVAAN
jgi:diguanylate cyclase (GGDEF)-like protein